MPTEDCLLSYFRLIISVGSLRVVLTKLVESQGLAANRWRAVSDAYDMHMLMVPHSDSMPVVRCSMAAFSAIDQLRSQEQFQFGAARKFSGTKSNTRKGRGSFSWTAAEPIKDMNNPSSPPCILEASYLTLV